MRHTSFSLGWKVVRRVGHRLCSALAGSQRPHRSQKWPGERVYYSRRTFAESPRRRAITVFASQSAALAWAVRFNTDAPRGFEVWQCKYQLAEMPKWAEDGALPEGTVFAAVVQLIPGRYGTSVGIRDTKRQGYTRWE